MSPNQHGEDPLKRQGFIQALQAQAEADPRLRALWFEGSLGRGTADRYSDVDVHVLLAEADLRNFQQDTEVWLTRIRPLVLFNVLFGGAMINAMTVDGLRLDLWPHAGDRIELDPARVLVLHSVADALSLTARPVSQGRDAARQLLGLIREFWRCISLLPAVIGRGEKLVAFQGLAVELGLVTELLIVGTGQVRDRGVKNLNSFLPPGAQADLEADILPINLSEQALVDAHLRLVQRVQVQGRQIAAQFGFEYPHDLESVVLRTVLPELKALGLKELPDVP